MKALLTRLSIGNYRGNLYIKRLDNKYFWAVECDMDNEDEWRWEEIPFRLYRELKKEIIVKEEWL